MEATLVTVPVQDYRVVPEIILPQKKNSRWSLGRRCLELSLCSIGCHPQADSSKRGEDQP